jgi:hypothetical protein
MPPETAEIPDWDPESSATEVPEPPGRPGPASPVFSSSQVKNGDFNYWQVTFGLNLLF